MYRCFRLAALFVLGSMICAGPLLAQEADTTTADTVVDTTAADTLEVETGPADSTDAVADTAAAPANTAEQATTSAADEERGTEAAAQSAQEWLALTDAGEFGESWDAADTTLKAQISREDWIDQGRRAQTRLDSLFSRSLSSTQYRESVPEIDGQQPVVILLYDSEYAVGSTREAVITTRREEGWKVAGYRVIPARAATDTTEEAAEETAQ